MIYTILNYLFSIVTILLLLYVSLHLINAIIIKVKFFKSYVKEGFIRIGVKQWFRNPYSRPTLMRMFIKRGMDEEFKEEIDRLNDNPNVNLQD